MTNIILLSPAYTIHNISFNMAENKTDHMLSIANFVSQILPQQQYMSQQQIDGYKSAFTADGYRVENKNFSSQRMSRRKNTASRELFV